MCPILGAAGDLESVVVVYKIVYLSDDDVA